MSYLNYKKYNTVGEWWKKEGQGNLAVITDERIS